MAIIEVKVPQLPESVSEATLMTWHKQVGQAVARDESLIDLETDKVVLELPAPQAGVLVKIVEQDGATVTSGQLIAHIDTEASAAACSAPARYKAATGNSRHNDKGKPAGLPLFTSGCGQRWLQGGQGGYHCPVYGFPPRCQPSVLSCSLIKFM